MKSVINQDKNKSVNVIFNKLKSAFSFEEEVSRNTTVGDAVIIADTNGNITYLNKEAENFTCLGYDEALNKPLDEVFAVKNFKTGERIHPLKLILKTGQITWQANHSELILKHRNEVLIAGSGVPVKNKKGKITSIVLVFREVTDAYRIQQIIKETNYRLIVENQTELVVKVDARGRFLFVSPTYCRTFGKNENELLGKHFMPLVHEDDRAATNEAMKNLAKPPHSVYVEQRALTVNGWRWLAWNDTAIVDEKGHIREIIGVGRDITLQKQAEEKLLHSHQLLQYILEHVKSAVAVLDNNLNYIYVSQKYLTDYNLGNRDVIGKNHYAIFPEISDEWKKIHQKALKGIVSGRERDCFPRKDGSVDWVRWEVRPWFEIDKSVGGIILYTEVITEQVEADELHIENERRLASLVGNLPGFVYRCKSDENWTMLYLSEQFKQITGYDTSDLILNRKLSYNDIIKDDFKNEIYKNWNYAIENKTRYNDEYQIITASNQVKWVWERGTGIFNKNGDLLFLEGYIEDITEKKKMIDDLIIAKEKAEESDRLKSAFLANMSHEIRTPMNGIMGFTELLKEPKLTGEKKDEYIKIIQKSGQRMLSTINDLIEISKIESGALEVQLREVNINEQLEYIYKFFKPEATGKGLEFTCHKALPDEEAVVDTDLEKLNGVLMNLIKNAIKYTTSGRIEFGYRPAGKKLEFYVKDTGIGIEEKHRKIIFERFAQADMSLSKPYEGAGLGLSIAQAYTEIIGGEMGFNSDPGKGSHFFFTIPFVQNEIQKVKTKPVKKLPNGDDVLKKLTILVAEDDSAGQIYLSELLKGKCKKVIFAENGNAAVQLFTENPETNLIFMDMKMPVMDGYEATARIKKINPDTVVIAQTAYAMSGDKEKAMAAGCDDYLSKPFSGKRLVEIVLKYFGD